LVLLDKPEGMTSHDVVNRLRRLFGTRAVGHAGTLDPMATGLLVLMVGEATKLSDCLLNGNKSYLAEITLGVETDTLDITGNVLVRKAVTVSQEELLSTISDLSGALELPVPSYSAIKVNGEKLYERARKNKEVPEIIRLMNFFKAEWVKTEGEKIYVRLACEKGGYVRSWAAELGRRLGSGATVSGLVRESSDPYQLKDAITLERLQVYLNQTAGDDSASVAELAPLSCISMANALPDLPRIPVAQKDESQQLVSLLEARQPAGFSIRRVFKELL
jgi:tRNA pseudouridine55 synthase